MISPLGVKVGAGFSENVLAAPLGDGKELICFLTGFTLWAGLPKPRGNREQAMINSTCFSHERSPAPGVMNSR